MSEAPHPSTTERRAVCALFVDVVNSTGLAHALPLPEYAELMTESLQLLMLACAAGGGEPLTHQGDAALALWREEDARFALAAALDLHPRLVALKAASRRGVRLELRVGVASGDVLFGKVGGATTAYGLPMNLARRLCDAAPPGGTLACARTQTLVPEAAWDTRPPLALRGFAPMGAGTPRFSPFGAEMKTS